MPWPWQLCRDCLDLWSGKVLHFPLQGDWLQNEWLLQLMRHTWEAWTFARKPVSKWTEWDTRYDQWVNFGRQRPSFQSDFQRWLEQNNG